MTLVSTIRLYDHWPCYEIGYRVLRKNALKIDSSELIVSEVYSSHVAHVASTNKLGIYLT